MISPENGWIFIHVQKTGGNSVRRALGLRQNDSHKHRFAPELREIYGEDTWRRCFKFAFVRNPWDRLVSWWHAIERSRAALDQGAKLNNFQRYILDNARSFDQFLLCDREIEDADGRKCIYRNQIDYLVDDIDFVGRFERLNADFRKIASRLGRPDCRLPHIGRSQHGPYTQYYSAATVELVAERYAQDVAAFGYRYGEARND